MTEISQLEFHLFKWACIRRIMAETGKTVTQALTEFNALVKS